jgi:tetratricopeptide (TPR) repeat protein
VFGKSCIWMKCTSISPSNRKSQLAIEFSYRVRELSPSTWVFWVHASNSARFQEGYKAIADMVQIPGREDPKADILHLVYRWLCNSGEPWLMLLDNADDGRVFFNLPDEKAADEKQRPLSTFLPQSSNGAILITTRDRDTAFRLAGRNQDIVNVEPMEQKDSLALLEKKLGADLVGESGAELVQALDFMPLAISQAAAYICSRPRSSVEKYLKDLRKSEQSKASLLDYDGGDLRRDDAALNSIITTWQISFEHIRSTRPSAAELLSLMSFFDRQGIPEYLLHESKQRDSNEVNTENRCDNDAGSEFEDGNTRSFEEDVATLCAYSLISTDIRGDSFEMHRLVQLSTRTWLKVHNQLEKWKQVYVLKLSTVFPEGTHENWLICEALLPHVEAMEAHRPADENSLLRWALVLRNAAWYLGERGNLLLAERMAFKAAATYEKLLGKEHWGTLMSVNTIAVILRQQGKYKQAEEMHRQALEGMEKALGKEHPNTLQSRHNLAVVLCETEHKQEALSLFRRTSAGYERVFGLDHPRTKACLEDYRLLEQEISQVPPKPPPSEPAPNI